MKLQTEGDLAYVSIKAGKRGNPPNLIDSFGTCSYCRSYIKHLFLYANDEATARKQN